MVCRTMPWEWEATVSGVAFGGCRLQTKYRVDTKSSCDYSKLSRTGSIPDVGFCRGRGDAIHSYGWETSRYCVTMCLHAIFFIRNTVEFQLVLFLKFPHNWTSFVAYLLLNFLKIFHSLFLNNMFYQSKMRFHFTA